MKHFKISLAVGLVTFLLGVYINYLTKSQYAFTSIIPLIMIFYVVSLVYLNAKVQSGEKSFMGFAQKELPRRYAPLKIFVSGVGLLLLGSLLFMLLMATIIFVFSDGRIE
jgi:ABC-type Fe3+ transport system permease subunit